MLHGIEYVTNLKADVVKHHRAARSEVAFEWPLVCIYSWHVDLPVLPISFCSTAVKVSESNLTIMSLHCNEL